MAVTDVFTALFAKRQAKQQTAREAYFAMRSQLAAGKRIGVDEIDVVLTAAGVSPERLQQDLADLAKMAELDTRRAKCAAEGDKAPGYADEATRLKAEFEEWAGTMRQRILHAEQNHIMASAQQSQIHHIDGQRTDLQAKLDRLPGDPEPVFDPYPNLTTEADVIRQQDDRKRQLRAEYDARKAAETSGRPRAATGPYIASELMERQPS